MGGKGWKGPVEMLVQPFLPLLLLLPIQPFV